MKIKKKKMLVQGPLGNVNFQAKADRDFDFSKRFLKAFLKTNDRQMGI